MRTLAGPAPEGIVPAGAGPGLLPDAIELASGLKHLLQDCLYLAAARRFDVPLITADRSFSDRAFPFDSRVALLVGCERN
jgi:predicted nucleic acid-binding protein